MAKLSTLFIVALLLCFTLSSAARSHPLSSSAKTHIQVPEAQHVDIVGENCDGVGEEECLMRRTLAAHLDYIYTQNHKP